MTAARPHGRALSHAVYSRWVGGASLAPDSHPTDSDSLPSPSDPHGTPAGSRSKPSGSRSEPSGSRPEPAGIVGLNIPGLPVLQALLAHYQLTPPTDEPASPTYQPQMPSYWQPDLEPEQARHQSQVPPSHEPASPHRQLPGPENRPASLSRQPQAPSNINRSSSTYSHAEVMAMYAPARQRCEQLPARSRRLAPVGPGPIHALQNPAHVRSSIRRACS